MSEVSKVFKMGDVALHRVLTELDISDKSIAFILSRYMDEVSFGVSSFDEEDLELMCFRILKKYSKYNNHFYDIINDFYPDFIDEGNVLNEIKKSVGV